MSDFPISNLLIMIFILVVLFIKYNLILYQKRKEQLRELSYKLKFTYSEKGNDLLLSRIEKYELFHKNVSQNSTFVIDLCNVINGNYHGTDVTIFDVTALLRDLLKQPVAQQTVIFFKSERLCFPFFRLLPKGDWKIIDILDFPYINIKTNRKFSRRYVLQSSNEDDIRKTFNEKVVAHLEKIPKKMKIRMAGEVDELIFFIPEALVSPKKIESFIEEKFELLNLFIEASSMD